MPDPEPFALSDHAKRRIAQRGITVTQVRRALLNPDRVEPDREDDLALHAIKRFYVPGGSVTLRVVYNPTKSPWQVITAFFDRKARPKR